MPTVEERVLAALQEAGRLKDERRLLLVQARLLREERQSSKLVSGFPASTHSAMRRRLGDPDAAMSEKLGS